jgi:Skp family chaperone for outer membrane proteins
MERSGLFTRPNNMRYLILIILIFIFSFSGFALAQNLSQNPEGPADSEKIDKIYQQIDQKALQPMKQLTDKLSESIEKSLEKVIEKIKEKKHQKQEEIKEEVKREVKEEAQEWGQGLAIWIEDQLSPLKIKIQEGSGLIREKIYQIKDWLIGLF